MIVRPNGLGETLGDSLALTKPLYTSGAVWYVNSAGGVDAAAPAGKDREKPLATLGQAQTNAAAGDIICLMTNHAETLTAALVLSKAGLVIVGGNNVSFTMNAANQDTFTVNVTSVEIRNIIFKESAQTNAGSTLAAKVGVNSVVGTRIIGCTFQQGPKDNLYGLFLTSGANNVRVENCSFISTATVVATRPLGAMGTSGGGTVADLELIGLTLSDGTVGYQNPAFNGGTTTLTRLKATGLSLLLGAEMEVGTLSGYVANPTSTGGGRFSG
jgi:hypothetical protein